MAVFSHLKKSGGSLIAFALLQTQVSSAADITVTSVLPGQPKAAAKIEAMLDTADKDSEQAVSLLERRYFDHDFHADAMPGRLSLLEELLFGQEKSGSVKERLRSLQDAARQENSSKTDKSGSQQDITNERLCRFERHYFQHDFQTESVSDRLSRLERLAYGCTKSGSPDSRLASISAVLLLPSLNTDKSAVSASISKTVSDSGGRFKAKVSFDSLLNAGIADFRAQRFHHAQDEFEKAISLKPGSPEAYADLGGTLLMLNDRPGAQESFRVCYALQPFGKIGAYARKQLIKIARDDAYEKTAAQDSQKLVERTLKTINRQTFEQTHMHQVQATSMAEYRMRLANIEIERLNAELHQVLDDVRAQRANNGRGPHFGDDLEVMQEMINLYNRRSSYQRKDGPRQANIALSGGLKHSAAVYDSAASLKEQILQPVLPGGARLRALGTSLYARYYGDGLPSYIESVGVDPAPPALQAVAGSLSKNLVK